MGKQDKNTVGYPLWSQVQLLAQVGELLWERARDTEGKTVDARGDVRAYRDSHIGSPGAGGWRRALSTRVDREGTAYMGEETDYFVCQG